MDSRKHTRSRGKKGIPQRLILWDEMVAPEEKVKVLPEVPRPAKPGLKKKASKIKLKPKRRKGST